MISLPVILLSYISAYNPPSHIKVRLVEVLFVSSTRKLVIGVGFGYPHRVEISHCKELEGTAQLVCSKHVDGRSVVVNKLFRV